MPARSEPVQLVRTGDGHAVHAVVSPVGASLQQLLVDGIDLVAGSREGPVFFSGAVLVPWPNRVRHGLWTLNGEPQQLEVTEPAAGNALHGLVAATPFAVTGQSPDAVEFSTHIRSPAGYPFDLDVTVAYRLTGPGVDATVAVVNRSARATPVAVGVHPYVKVGNTAPEDLMLQVGAERTIVLGADNLPVGVMDVADSPYDLRTPTPLRRAPSHAAFTGLRLRHDKVGMRLSDRKSGRAAEVWADARFRWAQVYVTDLLPGTSAGGVAVALEPMTAPPDAFNSGTDVEWLGPQARWVLSWGVRLRNAAGA